MSAIDRIETERLICERERTEHVDDLCVVILDPEVLRTTWVDPVPPSRSHIIDKLAGDIDHWERFGFGPWLIRDRDSGGVVGRGGLKHTMVTRVDEVEIGWTIVPARWGQGLATEVALTSVRTAFDELGIDEVIAYTSPDNIASRRVMDKAGMAFDREIVHAGLPHVLYRARRDRP